MMFWQVISILVVTALGLVGAQAPSDCAVGCVKGVLANVAAVGCTNGDTLCVCGKTESVNDGIRDCINAACLNDLADVQIPLAESYAVGTCATLAASAESSATSTATPTPLSPEPQATPLINSAPLDSAASIPSAQTTVSSTQGASSAANLQTSPSATSTKATTNPGTSTAPSVGHSSPTTLTISHPLATASSTANSAANHTASPSTSNNGLSTAVKAGIGAGVGAAVLAAIIIALCVFLRRRRQKKQSVNRARIYKISEPITEPMAASGHPFATDVPRAETALPKPKPIITRPVHLAPVAQPVSPTSVYSDSSDLENHTKRYDDVLPRTQPKAMI
ncbi:hypothetical protein GGS21DRAFT_394020 [Xylaria nigripes]|nr:hypothetical protein GGS21DRAFT_394020 [Xylaria nigripes]